MRLSGMCLILVGFGLLPLVWTAQSQSTPPATGSSSSSRHTRQKSKPASDSPLESGVLSEGAYRNRSLGFSCSIPAGWVLRTDEMNSRDEGAPEDSAKPDAKEARVLLASFSRPPEAVGEDVNSSILIAAERASAYPGLKEAAQYFGPVEEIAKAQGLAVAKETYEIAVGNKALAREDFQKDVGSRVLRQSTLVMLSRGYVVSFTFIGGTEDEIEELINGLNFTSEATIRQK